MQIQTTRFGPLTLTEEDILLFGEGLLGFNGLRKFVLLDDPNDEIFVWLQSCENPGIAFPVLEPELFTQKYQVKLNKSDMEILKLDIENPSFRVFNIITLPDDPTQMTANLKAPIVINVGERLARQCVLQDNQLAIREPIFSQLQQRVVAQPESSIRSKALDWGVAVPLPISEAKPEATT